MKNLIVAAAVALTTLLPTAASAQSDDELRMTVGVRLWRTDWSTWYDLYEYHHAPLETTVIPVGSLRYKDFLVSGSYMVAKNFNFTVSPTHDVEQERKEYDVNFGYFILPGLVASVGWKGIDYHSDSYKWSAKGFTVGMSGSAPLAPQVSLYGNLAYGWPKMQDYGTAFNNAKGRYLLTEFGLAFPLGQVNEMFSRSVLTAGYRYQRVSAFPNAADYPRVELYEYTQGPVAGLSIAF